MRYENRSSIIDSPAFKSLAVCARKLQKIARHDDTFEQAFSLLDQAIVIFSSRPLCPPLETKHAPPPPPREELLAILPPCAPPPLPGFICASKLEAFREELYAKPAVLSLDHLVRATFACAKCGLFVVADQPRYGGEPEKDCHLCRQCTIRAEATGNFACEVNHDEFHFILQEECLQEKSKPEVEPIEPPLTKKVEVEAEMSVLLCEPTISELICGLIMCDEAQAQSESDGSVEFEETEASGEKCTAWSHTMWPGPLIPPSEGEDEVDSSASSQSSASETPSADKQPAVGSCATHAIQPRADTPWPSPAVSSSNHESSEEEDNEEDACSSDHPK